MIYPCNAVVVAMGTTVLVNGLVCLGVTVQIYGALSIRFSSKANGARVKVRGNGKASTRMIVDKAKILAMLRPASPINACTQSAVRHNVRNLFVHP